MINSGRGIFFVSMFWGIDMKKKVSLVCTKCGSRNYATIKSAEAKKIRLEINKFCKKCNAHTLHQEAK